MTKALKEKLHPSLEKSETKSETKLDELNDAPFFPLNIKELLRFMIILLKSSLPTSFGGLWAFASGLISLRFAGKYGDPSELAGVTLASTWSGVFCFAILGSVTQGFGVIANQLVGAKKFTELGILFQKNLFALGLIIAPVLATFLLADTVLIGLGLDYDVSINVGIYLKSVIPSVIGTGIFESLKAYLIAQGYFNIQPVMQATFTIFHLFWCYLFVVKMNMPVAGVAFAKSVTDLCSAGALWIFIKFNDKFTESWIPWTKSCIQNTLSYLKQTLTIGANLYVQWVSIEFSLFIISSLNDKYLLGAHGIAISVIVAFFMLPLGNCISMQAFFGNAIGEGSKHKAQKFMAAGLFINTIITLVNMFAMMVWNDDIASFFTEHERTKEALRTMIYIYSISSIADNFVNHLTAVLKSIGGERAVFKCLCIAYLGIGINFEWIFGVALGYGYIAVWIGMMIAMYLMCIWAAWRVITLDWDGELAKVHQKINAEKYQDENQVYIEMVEK